MADARANAIGIVVSGGPAPGINCVISSAVIEAEKAGIPIFGLQHGFKGAVCGEPHAIQPLTIASTALHYNRGGSILGISRFNPFRDQHSTTALLEALRARDIGQLIVIGGEGSAYLSHRLSECAPHLRVVHVPKTIDNDLMLPNHHPSFGFETARQAGTAILETLTLDARTTQRWFIVTAMGRRAGFLALGIGLAAGATLTVIPEEFADGPAITPAALASIIYASMRTRARQGKRFGVAVIAEGVIDKLDPSTHHVLRACPHDDLGRIDYSQIELADVLLPDLRQMCHQDGDSEMKELKIIGKNIGYELRCHDPISFDVEYTRFLGYGAVRLLREGRSGVMVTREYDHLGTLPLASMLSPSGGMRSRTVDLHSDYYHVARSFMIRE